jgi:hypothetical protein
MKLEETKLHCPISGLTRVSEGIEKIPNLPFITGIKFMIRRRLNPKTERWLKNYTNGLLESRKPRT